MPFVRDFPLKILFRPFVLDLNILRFDGTLFKTEKPSTHHHRLTYALGIYKEQPFVTGSHYPYNKQTEIMNYGSQQWNVVAEYPFSSTPS